MAEEYIKMVQDKESELSELRSRMDADKDLAQLASYVMKNAKGQEVPNVVNVTLNKPAVFAANVEAALNNASEQVNIVTEDRKVDKDHIGDCVRSGLAAANGLLRSQGKWPLNPYFDQQMCRRGRAAARVTFHLSDIVDAQGKIARGIRPEIVPFDSRYFAYETGKDGLAWAAPRTKRSKADILAEYPEVKIDKSIGEVVDFWNSEVNAVYIEEKKILEQANPYGYVPYCVQLVTLGSMLADDDAKKYQGESIFFLIRSCIPEINRLISIMQTLNMISIKWPMTWQSERGEQEAPKYDDVVAPGSITPAERGGGAFPIAFGDLKSAAVYALNVMDNAIKQGSLEIVDVGTLPGPLSAVALIEIGEGRDQVFLPRLAARGLLNQQIADMFLRQIIDSGESKVELGTKGRKRTFDVKKLQGSYEVEFNYYVKSPKIDIARYSVAQAAKAVGLPQEDIDKNVLNLEDPDGVRQRRSWEMAEKLSPLVLTRRVIKDLSEMEDDDARLDAEILAADMNIQMDKLLAGEISTTIKKPEEKQATGQPLLPLMNEGTAAGSASKAAQLKATPRQSGGE